MRPVNKTIKKKILELHAEWLKQNGYKKEYKNCVKQIKEMKRTCVHAMPRASLCTTTLMCGAFAPVEVRARKLRGLYE
jgi:hypothetical protein